MRVSHIVEPVFDDPNLIGLGGLPAVLGLAEQAGLHDLVDEHVTVPGTAGANASVKVSAIIAGMIAGADSISDLDVLRHGGMGRVFTGTRAATTLGTHLRSYQFGHVRQLDAVASRLLVNLARVTPILDGADQITYVDVDDTIRETHGYRKQGVAYGYSRVKGLNAQLAIISTPLAAPVIAATRLRKGNIDSGHGAARLIGDSLATLRKAVATTPGVGGGPGRQRLLPPRRDRGRDCGWGPILGHRAVEQGRGQGHRRHRRDSLDHDPVPRRDL